MGSKVHLALEDFGFAFHVGRTGCGEGTERGTQKGKERNEKLLSVTMPATCFLSGET